MKQCVAFVLLATGLASVARADPLILVENGQPKARIVVGADTTPSARFAARELQHYIQKSTGATLPIVDQRSTDGTVDIVVGAGKIAEQLGVTTAGLTRDAFRMKTVGDAIVILGRDDPKEDPVRRVTRRSTWATTFEHATIFGAYEFLERFLGVRWYFFLPVGEVVPKHQTVAMPGLDVLEKPNKLARHASPLKSLETVKEGREAGYKLGYGTIEMGLKNGEERVKRRNLFALRARHSTILKCYGPAAGPMGKFWDEIEAKFPTYRGKVVETPMGPEKQPRTKEGLWTDVYDRPTLERWTAYFQEAVRLASESDDPMHLQRVQFMKENVLDFIVSERPEGL
ncbi:MAG: hypothetical protein JXR37_25215 [Kiritimatiellae bacterium]|nr:hypothetical protein [Kiritimatiellia bacterium]